jgi:hypothetical protein
METERAVHQKEKDVLMRQVKDLQDELQSVKVSVCCKHLALQYYWDMHGTFGLSPDLVNETCQCAYSTCEIHFRALLIKNNLNAGNVNPLT